MELWGTYNEDPKAKETTKNEFPIHELGEAQWDTHGMSGLIAGEFCLDKEG